MPIDEVKGALHRSLRLAREAVLWKLDGLSEYDLRRPMVATGTNLLGLVKHLSFVEAGYFGTAFGRPIAPEVAWDLSPDADPTADLWATADELPVEVVDRYRASAAQADALIEELPLDAPGRVPWWPEGDRDVTLFQLLVVVAAETSRHAGHADILRELIDGTVGLRAANTNVPDLDAANWAAHRAHLEQVARAALR